METYALKTWAHQCIRYFAPLRKQEDRVLFYVTISCRRRFPELPLSTIQEVVKHLWDRYLRSDVRSLR